jgi:hypothetical protein
MLITHQNEFLYFIGPKVVNFSIGDKNKNMDNYLLKNFELAMK